MNTSRTFLSILAPALALAAPAARADGVTRWNERACEEVVAAGVPAPESYRVMAVVQSAVESAVTGLPPDAPAVEVDAAVAAATRSVLAALVPARRTQVEEALAMSGTGPSRDRGTAAGERAAAAALARAEAVPPEAYRPRTEPGVYVPTTLPAASQWPRRKPWGLARPDQFRPGPPPALSSDRWARDLDEVRRMGARSGSQRTAEQTEMARFWEATTPSIYFGLVRSAVGEGRDPRRNARLLAAAARAMDDALIAVFDAKYHYQLWRPITAIRNADLDGNDATGRDPSWLPLVETPMHPEYPCAHCTLASTVATVLQAEAGGAALKELSATSPTLPGVTRRYPSLEAFVEEVSTARILDGVHYRASAEAGTDLGRKVGGVFARRIVSAR